MLPNTTLPSGYFPPGAYDEHYGQPVGDWRAHSLVDGQSHFRQLQPNAQQSSLNAAVSTPFKASLVFSTLALY